MLAGFGHILAEPMSVICEEGQKAFHLKDLAAEDDGVGSEVSTELGVDDGSVSRQVSGEEDSGAAAPTRYENLIIFDWDDTLLPTTWLREHGLLEEGARITQEQDAQLKALADLASAAVRAAKSLGGVAIVTNAEAGWVEMSCGAFMPSLDAELSDVRIVSARADHERHGLLAPTAWKCLAFAELVDEFHGSPPSCAGGAAQRRNVVSLGDSEHEREALSWVCTGGSSWAKSLKFMERPSLAQLADQLELSAGCLEEVVSLEGSAEYEVGVEDE